MLQFHRVVILNCKYCKLQLQTVCGIDMARLTSACSVRSVPCYLSHATESKLVSRQSLAFRQTPAARDSVPCRAPALAHGSCCL
jgi:hypothetical protein